MLIAAKSGIVRAASVSDRVANKTREKINLCKTGIIYVNSVPLPKILFALLYMISGMESLSKLNYTAFNAFLQGTTSLNWVKDIHSNLMFANQSSPEHFNVSPEMLDINISEVLPQQLADTLAQTHGIIQLGKKHTKHI